MPVKSSGFFQGLTAPVTSAFHECNAFFDSGAAINIIKTQAFNKVSSSSTRPIPCSPPDLTVSGISGNIITPQKKALLTVSLSPVEPPVIDYFYVIDDVCFHADMLIGYHTMSRFNISLFPSTHQIAQNGTFLSAAHPPGSHYSSSFTSVTPSPHTTDLAMPVSSESLSATPVPPPSPPSTPAASPSDQLPPDTDQPSLCNTLSAAPSPSVLGKAVLIAPAVIKPADLCLARVTIRSVLPGTDIICLPDTARVNGVRLESTLSTVESDGSSIVALQNATNQTLSLQSGVYIGDVFPSPAPVTPVISAPCLASISSPPVSDSPDPLSPILAPHLGEIDFPESEMALLSLLNASRSCVSLPGEPLGKTDAVRHAIHLTPGSTPTYVPAYRIPHSRRTKVDDAVRTMLDQDIIEPAASPFNAPLLLIPKANGESRVVVDFRRLNSITVPDRYPMPVLSDLLQSIGESNAVFSTLDLQSGFFQVELEEYCRPYTAFTTSSGQYAFKRMAMGLRNSPLTFVRLMNSTLSGLLGNSVFCYMDDLIIASKNLSEHLDTLSEVLARFAKSGLKIKLSKCQFLKREIRFLGHKVDCHGIHTLNDKIHAISEFPVPSDADAVRSFIGLAGFYRQFIKDFSLIAQPLTSLLKKNAIFTWSDDCQTAFTTLKHALCNAPVLAFPDFTMPFVLCTDASNYGLGSVLMQHDANGKSRAIAFASRLLNAAERNYSTTHREALAVVWSLRHFRDIILGYPIHVLTDHAAVTDIFKGTSLTGKFARWQITIQEYNPTFSYLPGKSNSVADALSRHVAPVAHLTAPQSLPSPDDIKALQRSDQFCSGIIYYLESGDSSSLPKLHVSPDSFELRDEVLYKSSHVTADDDSVHHASQLVVPQALVPVILYHVHDSPFAGHPGKDRSLRQAQRSYFWPSMRKDISRHCLLCVSCAEHRPARHFESPNLPYPIPHAPWDSLSIDVLKLPLTEKGNQYLLVCVDSFSRYTILVPLKDKSAKSVARALIDDVICRYSAPRVLLSDNGTEFNNTILQAVCESFHIKKCNIVPYSPQANGKVERANRRILDILRFITSSVSAWDDHIPLVACSLNSAIHSSINEAPHFVLFGTDKRLPHQFLSAASRPVYCFDDYVKSTLNAFQRIHTSVRDHLSDSQESMIEKQHRRSTQHVIELGDIVFHRVHDRHSKLDPLFHGPHRVTELLHGHKVKLVELHTGKETIVHRDHLKRVDKGFDTESTTARAQPPSGSDRINCQPALVPPR